MEGIGVHSRGVIRKNCEIKQELKTWWLSALMAFVKLAYELKTRETVVTLSGVGGPWTLLCTKIWWFSWGKFLGSCLSCIQNGLFFHGTPLYWITRVIQTLVCGRHFLQNKQNEPNTLREKKKPQNWQFLLPMIKLEI